MQWVETTGRTIEDAKEAALDQLGIDETEAEFEILEEPKTGLFGRVRNEARVRARVLPKSPRPKQERRPRRTRGRDDSADTKTTAAPKAAADSTRPERPKKDSSRTSSTPKRARSGGSSSEATTNEEGKQMNDEVVTVGEQADIITEFLRGLLDALGVEGTIERSQPDEDTIELDVVSESGDLGLLIGPKGQTLSSVHELSRAVLQRRAPGRHDGRVRIDVGGYRHRRQEALARFVRDQAAAVVDSGVARSLEPMNAVDRKVVHDTVNDIEGASTISEGVDPDRRVVIVPQTTAE